MNLKLEVVKIPEATTKLVDVYSSTKSQQESPFLDYEETCQYCGIKTNIKKDIATVEIFYGDNWDSHEQVSDVSFVLCSKCIESIKTCFIENKELKSKIEELEQEAFNERCMVSESNDTYNDRD